MEGRLDTSSVSVRPGPTLRIFTRVISRRTGTPDADNRVMSPPHYRDPARLLALYKRWSHGEGDATQESAISAAALNILGAVLSLLCLALVQSGDAQRLPVAAATCAFCFLAPVLIAGRHPKPPWMLQTALALDNGRMATEDIELTWRRLIAAWKTAYEPRALVGMQAPPSLSALWAQRKRWARGQGEVLHCHMREICRWRNHRMWLLGLESVASLIWVFCLACSLVLAVLNVLFDQAFGSFGVG